MNVARRTQTKVMLTHTEFLEALGLEDEGYIQNDIKVEWTPDYHRQGSGATVVTINLIKHKTDRHRKAGPRRKR
jgi:hypothetical protein